MLVVTHKGSLLQGRQLQGEGDRAAWKRGQRGGGWTGRMGGKTLAGGPRGRIHQGGGTRTWRANSIRPQRSRGTQEQGVYARASARSREARTCTPSGDSRTDTDDPEANTVSATERALGCTDTDDPEASVR